MDSEFVIESRREYYREWGAKNRDKRKAANARYWQKYAARKMEEKNKEKEMRADEATTDINQ